MTRLRGQEAYSLALMRTHGREDEAEAYLDALNAFPKAFGLPLFDMPDPLPVGLPDLVTVDAGQVSVSDVLGEQLERDLKFTDELLCDAARAARAVAASRSRRVSPSRPSGLPSTIARKTA